MRILKTFISISRLPGGEMTIVAISITQTILISHQASLQQPILNTLRRPMNYHLKIHEVHIGTDVRVNRYNTLASMDIQKIMLGSYLNGIPKGRHRCLDSSSLKRLPVYI